MEQNEENKVVEAVNLDAELAQVSEAQGAETITTPNGLTVNSDTFNDPALAKQNFVKVNEGYKHLQAEWQKDREEIKRLKADLAAKEAAKVEVKPETKEPVPTGNRSIADNYVMKLKATEDFKTAAAWAEKTYGKAQVEKMSMYVAPVAQKWINEGKHDANFKGLILGAFNKLIAEDDEFVKEFSSFRTGGVTTTVETEAEKIAKANLLKATAQQGVIPTVPTSQGATVVTAPVAEERITVENRKAKAQAMISEWQNKTQ